MVEIRPAGPSDVDGIGDVWLTSWRATFDFEPGHPDEDVRRWLANVLVPRNETWVAVDNADGSARVVGVMALSDMTVEQLYLAPDWFGRSIGRRFIDLAKSRRPDGLDLHCFAVNDRARRFYEHNGFAAVAFGDGSGNEERQPDVRYVWRPAP
ncbi:MAG: GNAT family N-acetyltransferase [Candidatus Limnocylindrales bacterium]